MKAITYISRLLVGSLFIVSGLIKANDPLGFSYKLEEYFQVFGMEWLSPAALLLAVGICILEIVLGAATLLAVKMRSVSWLLLLLIVFFTFLTFYSAYFNKVTDCGCFGDALKLTPWQSFWKDIALLILVLFIFVRRRSITQGTRFEDLVTSVLAVVMIAVFCLGILNNPWAFPIWFTVMMMTVLLLLDMIVGQNRADAAILAVSTLFSLVFSVYCIRHLPVKDFRPYAVGKDIARDMKGVDPVIAYKYRLKDKKTGKEQLFEQFPENYQENYDYVGFDTTVLKPGIQAPIHDFSIMSEEGDLTEEILSNPGYSLMIVAYDLHTTDLGTQEKLNAVLAEAEKIGIKVFGLTASTDRITDFRHEVQAMYPYYVSDGTALKTIIRANPGIVLLKGGVVVAKWHYRDLPDFGEMKKLYLQE